MERDEIADDGLGPVEDDEEALVDENDDPDEDDLGIDDDES